MREETSYSAASAAKYIKEHDNGHGNDREGGRARITHTHSHTSQNPLAFTFALCFECTTELLGYCDNGYGDNYGSLSPTRMGC